MSDSKDVWNYVAVVLESAICEVHAYGCLRVPPNQGARHLRDHKIDKVKAVNRYRQLQGLFSLQ